MRFSGSDLVYRRLSFGNNGAVQSFSAGGSSLPSPVVENCFFSQQLALQDDGAFVEGGGVRMGTLGLCGVDIY